MRRASLRPPRWRLPCIQSDPDQPTSGPLTAPAVLVHARLRLSSGLTPFETWIQYGNNAQVTRGGSVTYACQGASVLLGRRPATLPGANISDILPEFLLLAASAAAAAVEPPPAAGSAGTRDRGISKSGNIPRIRRSEISASRGDGATLQMLVEARVPTGRKYSLCGRKIASP